MTTFVATKKIGTFIEFDENNRLWLVPDGMFGRKAHPRIYRFEDILAYEVLEDEESVVKGGIGRALVGGLVFGGVGAVVGGVTGKKKQKTIVNKLTIKITVNDFSNPVVFINLIKTPTQTTSPIYRTYYDLAQQILSTLCIIQAQIEMLQAQQVNAPSQRKEGFIFCKKCGYKLPESSSFCSSCGEKLE